MHPLKGLCYLTLLTLPLSAPAIGTTTGNRRLAAPAKPQQSRLTKTANGHRHRTRPGDAALVEKVQIRDTGFL
jgi:hypothetical protein